MAPRRSQFSLAVCPCKMKDERFDYMMEAERYVNRICVDSYRDMKCVRETQRGQISDVTWSLSDRCDDGQSQRFGFTAHPLGVCGEVRRESDTAWVVQLEKRDESERCR
ncbi:hypothetical protein QQF64_004951, partial [Cirrhinus molitorella]